MKPRVPRPPNSFMLFRKDRQPGILARIRQREEEEARRMGTVAKKLNSRDVSSVVADEWKRADVATRMYYQRKAEDLRRAHRVLYPDFRYTMWKPATIAKKTASKLKSASKVSRRGGSRSNVIEDSDDAGSSDEDDDDHVQTGSKRRRNGASTSPGNPIGAQFHDDDDGADSDDSYRPRRANMSSRRRATTTDRPRSRNRDRDPFQLSTPSRSASPVAIVHDQQQQQPNAMATATATFGYCQEIPNEFYFAVGPSINANDASKRRPSPALSNSSISSLSSIDNWNSSPEMAIETDALARQLMTFQPAYFSTPDNTLLPTNAVSLPPSQICDDSPASLLSDILTGSVGYELGASFQGLVLPSVDLPPTLAFTSDSQPPTDSQDVALAQP
ncbi:hypothetical protein HK101_002339, partial [Irineochytrium annulatum]